MKYRTIFLIFILSYMSVGLMILEISATDCDKLVIYVDNSPEGVEMVEKQIYSYLNMIAPGESTKILPGLARNWTRSSDWLEWSFKLRGGLVFHDSTPITAVDIEYSWKAGLYENGLISSVNDSKSLDYFEFSYRSPDSLEFSILLSYNFGQSPRRILYPTLEWDIAGQSSMFKIIPEGSDLHSEVHISAGPYKLVMKNNNSVDLVPFDKWFGWGDVLTSVDGEAYAFPKIGEAFQFVEICYISDYDVLSPANFGKYDLILSEYIPKSIIDQFDIDPGFLVNYKQLLSGSILKFNTEGDYPLVFYGSGNFPCSDTLFRQAFSHAINRSQMSEEISIGSFKRPDWVPLEIINDSNISLTGSLYSYNVNQTKSEELLNNNYPPLGFVNETDNRLGWNWYANETHVNGLPMDKGRHLSLFVEDNPWSVEQAEFIKERLLDFGIYLDLQIVPSDEYFLHYHDGDSPFYYNHSYMPEPDPNFSGPPYDILLDEVNYRYDFLGGFIPQRTIYNWVYGKEAGSVHHILISDKFEVAYAKVYGGGTAYGSGFPTPFFDIPVWESTSGQYSKGIRDALEELTFSSVEIPLLWHQLTVIASPYIDSIYPSANGIIHVAFLHEITPSITYLSTTLTTSKSSTPFSTTGGSSLTTEVTTNTSSGFIVIVLFLSLGVVYLIRIKKLYLNVI